MAAVELHSYAAAARRFAVDPRTIADLSRILGLQPLVLGKSRGLLPEDMERLRAVLGTPAAPRRRGRKRAGTATVA